MAKRTKEELAAQVNWELDNIRKALEAHSELSREESLKFCL
jgi:hypothetical protein